MKIRIDAALPPGRLARLLTVAMLVAGGAVAIGLPVLVALYLASALGLIR